MEKVLPESVPTRHLSGPLSPHELQQLFAQAPVGVSIHRNSIDTGKMRRSSLDPTFLLA